MVLPPKAIHPEGEAQLPEKQRYLRLLKLKLMVENYK